VAVPPSKAGHRSQPSGAGRIFGRVFLTLSISLLFFVLTVASLFWADARSNVRRLSATTIRLITTQAERSGPDGSSTTMISVVRTISVAPDVIFIVDQDSQVVSTSLTEAGEFVASFDPRVRAASLKFASQISQPKAAFYESTLWIDYTIYFVRCESFGPGPLKGWSLVMVSEDVNVVLFGSAGAAIFIAVLLFGLSVHMRISYRFVATGDLNKSPGLALSTKRATRVLVVDDDEDVRRNTVNILMRRHCRVIEAGSCDAAIMAWGLQRFDFILMDMNMPGRDGCETASALRAREVDGSRVPILCLTSLPTPHNRDLAIKAGMDGILGKPLEMKSLVTELRRIKAKATRTFS
jgi:CheY-like chemotaxis protein